MKISLCMIFKNEERCLRRNIESVKGEVDEIICVDTGSTDNGIDILKQIGVHPYFFEWTGSFSDAKNFAISKATGDFIVFLDADEFIPQKFKGKLRGIIEKLDNKAKNYYIFSNHINDGEFDKDTNEWKTIGISIMTRIFRNHPTLKYSGLVHEVISVEESLSNEVYLLSKDDFMLYHDGYSKEVLIVKDKNNRNLILLKEEEKKGKTTPMLMYFLAQSYYNLKNYEESYKYIKKYFKMGIAIESISFLPSHYLFRTIQRTKRDFANINTLLELNIKAIPNHSLSYAFYGLCLYKQGKLLEAEKYLKKFARLDVFKKDKILANRKVLLQYYIKAYRCLAKIAFESGNQEYAVTYTLSALKHIPGYRPLINDVLKYTRGVDEGQVASLLLAAHNERSDNDLTALVDCMSKYKPFLAYMHIFEKWFNLTNKTNKYFYIMKIVVGQAGQVVDMFLDLYNKSNNEIYLDYAMVSAINSGDVNHINNVNKLFDDTRQLSMFYRYVSVCGFDENAKKIALNLDNKTIAMILYNQCHYTEAIEYFFKVSKEDLNKKAFELYRSYIMVGDFKNAFNTFQTYKASIKERKSFVVLHSMRCNDQEIKKKLFEV